MVYPEIDIIGTGNLAHNLAPALEQSGFVINTIYGRTLKSAKKIADRLYQASVTDSLDFSNSKSKVFFLAVTDDAIESVSRELILPDEAIIAHTSGFKSLSTLGYTASPNIGVFYPLQTFSKLKRVSFTNIPIMIEGDNRLTEKMLYTIAGKMSDTVQILSSPQRKLVHLAAVFASNFTNALLMQANELLCSTKLDLQLLAPLIQETMAKSLSLGPENAQTGPASRGDLEVLDNQMKMLDNYPDIQDTYRLLTQQILNRSETD